MRPLQNYDAWREMFIKSSPIPPWAGQGRRLWSRMGQDRRAERLGCRETDAAKRPKGDSLGRENHQSLALIHLRTGFGATSRRVNDGIDLMNKRPTGCVNFSDRRRCAPSRDRCGYRCGRTPGRIAKICSNATYQNFTEVSS